MIIIKYLMGKYLGFGMKSWKSSWSPFVRSSRSWSFYCSIVGLSLVMLINWSMNDEVMDVWSFNEYDNCEMMIVVLLLGVEGNSHVHLMTMLWSNVLTWY